MSPLQFDIICKDTQMSSPLNIRNPRAHQLAQELATRRGTTITAVVVGALEAELEREQAKLPLRDRLDALAGRALAMKKPGGRDISEAERDDMWTR